MTLSTPKPLANWTKQFDEYWEKVCTEDNGEFIYDDLGAFITSLIERARQEGYEEGYSEGCNDGALEQSEQDDFNNQE